MGVKKGQPEIPVDQITRNPPPAAGWTEDKLPRAAAPWERDGPGAGASRKQPV